MDCKWLYERPAPYYNHEAGRPAHKKGPLSSGSGSKWVGYWKASDAYLTRLVRFSASKRVETAFFGGMTKNPFSAGESV